MAQEKTKIYKGNVAMIPPDPEDKLLREAARKIREGYFRHLSRDPDMVEARQGFYTVMLIIFKSMQDAGWSRFNALVLIATMAWITMNDNPPPERPPEEGS